MIMMISLDKNVENRHTIKIQNLVNSNETDDEKEKKKIEEEKQKKLEEEKKKIEDWKEWK